MLQVQRILKSTVLFQFSSVQFSSVTQSCPTLCDPMNRSTPGLPVYHQLQEFTQTHVHWVGDAIPPSHPLSSPSPPALNLSQHQSLFKWVSSLHQVAKVLEFYLKSTVFSSLISYYALILLYSSDCSCIFPNASCIFLLFFVFIIFIFTRMHFSFLFHIFQRQLKFHFYLEVLPDKLSPTTF